MPLWGSKAERVERLSKELASFIAQGNRDGVVSLLKPYEERRDGRRQTCMSLLLMPKPCPLADEAIRRGILDYVPPSSTFNPHSLYDGPIYMGNLPCVQLLHDHGCPWQEGTLRHAVSVVPGHAASRQRISIVEFLIQEGCPMHACACTAAALNGSLECLRLLRTAGCPWDSQVLSLAIENKHHSLVEYVLAEGCPLSPYAAAAACGVGDLALLQRLVHLGCKCSYFAARAAAERGHVACMMHVMSVDPHCVASPYIYEAAAEWGSLECLRAAVDAGCPLSDTALVRAAARGHLHVVRFLHAKGVSLWREARPYEGFGARAIQDCCQGDNWDAAGAFSMPEFHDDAEVVIDRPVAFFGMSRPDKEEWLYGRAWATLRYGAFHGAPLLAGAEAFLKTRRARAREVLMCFQVAARRSFRQRPLWPVWATMASVPRDLLPKILEGAQLEIIEAFQTRRHVGVV